MGLALSFLAAAMTQSRVAWRPNWFFEYQIRDHPEGKGLASERLLSQWGSDAASATDRAWPDQPQHRAHSRPQRSSSTGTGSAPVAAPSLSAGQGVTMCPM